MQKSAKPAKPAKAPKKKPPTDEEEKGKVVFITLGQRTKSGFTLNSRRGLENLQTKEKLWLRK
jgi:hypothetical protein